MNFRRIGVIIGKEWRQTFRNWSAWFAIVMAPLIATGLFVFVAWKIKQYGAQPGVGKMPVWAMDCFLIFFATIPVNNAARFAASSVMEDKASRSLEPLLATPVTPGELLAGKTAVAVAPAVLTTYACCLFYIFYVRNWGMTTSLFWGQTSGLFCLCSLLSILSLLTIFAAFLGFLIATIKTDARSAITTATEIANLMLLLPAIGVYGGITYQMSGITWTLSVVALLLLADALVLFVGVSFFQREKVLFKWK